MKNLFVAGILAIGSCFLTCGAVAAGAAVPGTVIDGVSWTPKYMVKSREGKVFFSSRNGSMFSQPVDIIPGRIYRLSGRFRMAEGSQQPCRFYFGMQNLNQDLTPIIHKQVTVIPNTETRLTAACKAEDTVLKVANADEWRKGAYKQVAFNISSDMSDLPNREISPDIANIDFDDDENGVITLKKPVGKAYPAGTRVRQHCSGNDYMFCSAYNQTLTREWKDFSATVERFSALGKLPRREWWTGTKKARIVILITTAKGLIEFSDVKLEIVK